MHRGAFVALAPLSAEDMPVLFEWINDRAQVLLSAPYRPVSDSQHAAWFEAIRQRQDTVIFGIRSLETGALLGSCQLHGIHPVHRSAELQIRLGVPAERGKGYGTEAVRLLLDVAFRDLNLHRVSAHVFSGNATALRVYEKAGFVREGLLRKAAHIDGEYVDVVVMGIVREDYAAR
jgi:RimJ/RimL family protein N-acetyltransferase